MVLRCVLSESMQDPLELDAGDLTAFAVLVGEAPHAVVLALVALQVEEVFSVRASKLVAEVILFSDDVELINDLGFEGCMSQKDSAFPQFLRNELQLLLKTLGLYIHMLTTLIGVVLFFSCLYTFKRGSLLILKALEVNLIIFVRVLIQTLLLLIVTCFFHQ